MKGLVHIVCVLLFLVYTLTLDSVAGEYIRTYYMIL